MEEQRKQILEDFKALLNGTTDDIKEQAEQLKTQFYRIYRQEQEEARQKADEVGDKIEAKMDEIELAFREQLAQYKQMRAEAAQKREAELEQNLLRKENIIAQMKEMAESETADVQENVKRFKELQAEWRTIGDVPPQKTAELIKQYNQYQEQFYDLVKINYELRDYDFKRNFDLKTALCEQAEALANNDNIVEAARSLQQLHADWSNIGPVARELRDSIWERFKAASTVINKKHQEYFDAIHAKEEENLQKKQDIIVRMQEIDLSLLTTGKMWEEATEKVTAMQAEWQKIGFAPKKMNQLIYDEYRALCDRFFETKAAFYKQLKDTLSENLQKKRSLVELAESLQDSENWKEATDKFVELQKQWKAIGPVSRKYADDIWKRFTTACDHFFERKKAANAGQHSEEKNNLDAKKSIIKEIEDLAITTKEETLAKLKELMNKYQGIGHVPFRDKDKLYKSFRAATDKIFDALNLQASERRMENFAKEVETKTEDALLNDRRRLVKAYENLVQEIQTAENNILFFTSKSNKGNKMVEDMQRKIQDLKNQLKELEKKIQTIDGKLN